MDTFLISNQTPIGTRSVSITIDYVLSVAFSWPIVKEFYFSLLRKLKNFNLLDQPKYFLDWTVTFGHIGAISLS